MANGGNDDIYSCWTSGRFPFCGETELVAAVPVELASEMRFFGRLIPYLEHCQTIFEGCVQQTFSSRPRFGNWTSQHLRQSKAIRQQFTAHSMQPSGILKKFHK